MLEKSFKIAAYLIIALGGAHLLFTPFNYHKFTLNALWFFSAGLAVIFAGFLNLMFIASTLKTLLARTLRVIANATRSRFFSHLRYSCHLSRRFPSVCYCSVLQPSPRFSSEAMRRESL
jgi:hypothetical protein